MVRNLPIYIKEVETMSYCIYLRKSRADAELELRGEGETLERHSRALMTLAGKMGLDIGEEYREIVSGETITARPEMQRLLSDVESGKWDGVLVMEVERLARGDTIDQGLVARTFKIHGTKIITPVKTYDPNDEFDEEYFEFGLFMARREYKAINRRIQRGRLASVKEGKYVAGIAPYGYERIKSPDGKGFILSPHPVEASVVQRIFSDYVAGIGANTIANKLTDEGIIPRVGTEWSPATIRDMLKNPVYTGKIRWQYKKYVKSATVDGASKKRYKSKDYMLIDGKHEALVSEETFNNAAKQMKLNTLNTTRSDLTLHNPLSGLVYCRECGKLMTRLSPSSRKDYASLVCKTRNCPTVSAPLYQVEDEVLKILKDYYENYELHFQTRHGDKAPKITNTAIKNLENKIKTIDNQLEKTYNLLEQGIYTVDVFTERQAKLKADKELLAQQLEEAIKLQSMEQKVRIPAKGEIKGVIELYRKCETDEARNKLLKQIVKRIDYSKTTANTRGKFENRNFLIEVYLNL